jgi:hypothetical protein
MASLAVMERRSRFWAVVMALGLLPWAVASARNVSSEDSDRLMRIRAATVLLEPGRCAGVWAQSDNSAPMLVTAAHCVLPREQTLPVILFDGRKTTARLMAINRGTDVAVLELGAAPHVAPLHVAENLPAIGDEVLFAGRNDRGMPLQKADLARLGRCPSLPAVPNALFTTLQAIPGDSGAPLVNDALEVVGLVHGGAACHIATPGTEILPVLADASGALLQCRPEDEMGVGGSGATP